MRGLILAILILTGVVMAQFQPDIQAWKDASSKIVYDNDYSDAGTPMSRIKVMFTQIDYEKDWLVLAKECATVYRRHIKKVSCFAYPTLRHLDAALPPKNQAICWSARYLNLNGIIQQERHTSKQLKQFGCPSE